MIKLLRKLLAASVVVGSLIFSPSAYAEIQTYEGVGECLIDEQITPESAEKFARFEAELDALNKIKNLPDNITQDDIDVVLANNLKSKIVDVKRFDTVVDLQIKYTKCNVTVKVDIDTDELKAQINDFISRDEKERASLIEKNKILKQLIDEKNNHVADLEKIIDNPDVDAAKIQNKFNQINNDVQVISKIAEGNKLCYEQKHDEAITLYIEAATNKVFEGIGEQIDRRSNLEMAKRLAGMKANRDLSEKFSVFIKIEGESVSVSSNNMLTIISAEYEVENIDADNVKVRAIVKGRLAKAKN